MKRKAFYLTFLAALFGATVFFAFYLSGHRYQYLILHHSAGDEGDYESIRQWHRKKGLRDAAYHLVLENGSLGAAAGTLTPTSRYERGGVAMACRDIPMNLKGLHLCAVGNFETHPVPPAMKPVLAHAVASAMEAHHISWERVLFHREIQATACPGKYVTKEGLRAWLRTEALQCPAEIAAGQDRVLASGRRLPASFLPLALLINGLAVLFVLVRFRKMRDVGRESGHRERAEKG